MRPPTVAQNADVIVLNTCVVRQSAEDRAAGHLWSLKPLKDRDPERVIALMGCMVGIKPNRALEGAFPLCGRVHAAVRARPAGGLPDRRGG